MNATDYRAVITNSSDSIICIEHFPLTIATDDNGNELVIDVVDCYPIFADSEWDSYPICDICGHVHDYVGLTTDGQKYEGVTYP